MTLSEALSLRINELLKVHKVTQYRLSMLSGVSQSTISDIRHMRNKDVNVRIIYEIAQGLGISLIDFFNAPYFDKDMLID